MKLHAKAIIASTAACALVGVVTLKSNRNLRVALHNYAFSLEMRMRASSMQDSPVNNGVRRAAEGKAKKPKASEDTPEGRLHLIWQLAYPFAGSTVALRILQDSTGYSMATNYGDIVDTNRGFEELMHESVPVNADSPNGPFKYRIDKPLPPGGSNVVTKTHCSGHCMDYDDGKCPLEDVVNPLTITRNFFMACSSGTKYHFTENGLQEEIVQYNPWQVKKIMILVRDPLQIVLARFLNLFDGGRDPGYAATQFGLSEFCKDYDKRQIKKGLFNWYSEANQETIKANPYGVKCHSELFRITHWYNQALRLSQYMGGAQGTGETGTHIVHFEDYDCDGCDVGQHITDMLNFVDIRAKESSMRRAPFERIGADDHPYFSEEEMDAMVTFIMNEANPSTLHLFKDYLGEVTPEAS